jgi:hypothetical protein
MINYDSGLDRDRDRCWFSLASSSSDKVDLGTYVLIWGSGVMYNNYICRDCSQQLDEAI